jgi:hypothetical protein
LEMMRLMRQMCFSASSNSTRSIIAFVSLYSASASSRICADEGVRGEEILREGNERRSGCWVRE